MWLCVWTEVQIVCIWSSWCHCRHLVPHLSQSRLVLPYWYQLTQVVLEKRPLTCLFHCNSLNVFVFLPTRLCAGYGPVSVTSHCSIKMAEPVKLVFAWDLPSSCHTLSFKVTHISSKIRVVPSGTLSWTPELVNFATAYRSSICVIYLARQKMRT